MSEFFSMWYDEVTGRFCLDGDQKYFAVCTKDRRIVHRYKKRSNALRDILQSGKRQDLQVLQTSS